MHFISTIFLLLTAGNLFLAANAVPAPLEAPKRALDTRAFTEGVCIPNFKRLLFSTNIFNSGLCTKCRAIWAI